MYKIYTDKNKTFSCDIEIEGANINESIARIIIESDNDVNLLYKGRILQNGKCEVVIDKMNFLPEKTQGKIKLEVIAEGTLFTPWESSFIVETNKKVKVNEIYDSDKVVISDKKVKVIVEEEQKEDINLIEEDINLITQINTLNNIIKAKNIKKDNFDKLFENYEKILAKKGVLLKENEVKYIKSKIII